MPHHGILTFQLAESAVGAVRAGRPLHRPEMRQDISERSEISRLAPWKEQDLSSASQDPCFNKALCGLAWGWAAEHLETGVCLCRRVGAGGDA